MMKVVAPSRAKGRLLIRKQQGGHPRIMEIRAGVRENVLRDPSRVTLEDCWFVDNPGIFVWVEDTRIVEFSRRRSTQRQYFWIVRGRSLRGAASRPFSTSLQCPRWAGCPRIWLTTARDTGRTVLPQSRMAVTGSHEGNLVFEGTVVRPSEQLHDGQPDAIRHDS
jgi:hypothetical protein